MDSTAVLIKKKLSGSDAVGNPKYKEIRKSVFVSVASLTSNQFHNNGLDGNKIDFRLELFYMDYSGEKEICFCGQRYDIYRTFFRASDEITELYLNEKAGVRNG